MKKEKQQAGGYFKVAENVWGMKDVFVNLYMVKGNEKDDWFLVDAGLKTSLPKIKKMAAALFGDKPPKAIVLTHGHFDHVGALPQLVEGWKVPVYTHYLELPYVTGKSHYPPPDPTVGGGMMAYMAMLYPTSPVNLGVHATALPEDGTIPGFPEWRYVHTPGHTFGHISLFREAGGVLIAGDAFITTKGESAIHALFPQRPCIWRPPAYFTTDWEAADDSIKKLVLLSPEVVATGHGKPMQGREMRRQLHYLHDHFFEKFVPGHGRYVQEPAVADASGVLYVPGQNINYAKIFLTGAAVLVTALAVTAVIKHRKKRFSRL